MPKKVSKADPKKSMPLRSAPKEIDAYIAGCPKDTRRQLKIMRAAIRKAAPKALETTVYFRIPGYSYPGYDYNGMFTWFDLQDTHINLRLRPPVIEEHSKDLTDYARTKSIVRFPLKNKIPVSLVAKLVKASVETMIKKSKKSKP